MFHALEERIYLTNPQTLYKCMGGILVCVGCRCFAEVL